MPRITAQTPVPDSGLDSETAREIFDQIDRFAGYGFNKSHAAAYAAISFQTAWLKTHYPEDFFAAAMNMDLDSVDDIARFADEIKKRDIPLRKPSINQSNARFRPCELTRPHKGHRYGITYALEAIRGVGRAAATAIETERDVNGPFRSFEDLTNRMDGQVNRTALRALAKAGAFDPVGLGRGEALARAEDRLSSAAATGQMSMFDALIDDATVSVAELDNDTTLDNELSVLGHYMSDHPLRGMKGRVRFRDAVLSLTKPPRSTRMAAIPTKIDVRRTNAGDIMAVITLSDPDGLFEALVFGDAWEDMRHQVKKGARLLLDMNVSDRGHDRRFFIAQAHPIRQRHDAVAA